MPWCGFWGCERWGISYETLDVVACKHGDFGIRLCANIRTSGLTLFAIRRAFSQSKISLDLVACRSGRITQTSYEGYGVWTVYLVFYPRQGG